MRLPNVFKTSGFLLLYCQLTEEAALDEASGFNILPDQTTQPGFSQQNLHKKTKQGVSELVRISWNDILWGPRRVQLCKKGLMYPMVSSGRGKKSTQLLQSRQAEN